MEGGTRRLISRVRMVYNIAIEGIYFIAQHQLSSDDGDDKVGGFNFGIYCR